MLNLINTKSGTLALGFFSVNYMNMLSKLNCLSQLWHLTI